MVTAPHFTTCPVRNVLARICVPDTLWIIHLLGLKGSATLEELSRHIPGKQLSSALNTLAEDSIIIGHAHNYTLSAIGKELCPLLSSLIAWCNKNILP